MVAFVSSSPFGYTFASSHRLLRHTTDSVASDADSTLKTRYRHVQEHSMTDKPNAIPSPWINVHEAAEYLDVCVDTIYDACAEGGLKHVRLCRRTIRVKREWLEAWIEAQARIAK
jgi:excisionase family DNA binding protein